MTYTMAQATLDLARSLARKGALDLYEGTATGGSATTLVDTGMRISGTNSGTATFPADDYFTGGPMWFLSGNNSGKCAQVTDFANSSKTWTFVTPGAACAAGNLYAVAPKTYPLDMLRRWVNDALLRIGAEDQYNETVTTSDNTERYALPATVYGLKAVYYRETGGSGAWIEHSHWYSQGGYVYFRENHWLPSGFTLRLVYNALASDVTTDAGTISDEIARPWLAAEATVAALEWMVGRTKDQTFAAFLNMAVAERDELRRVYRPRLTQRPHAWQHSPWAVPEGR